MLYVSTPLPPHEGIYTIARSTCCDRLNLTGQVRHNYSNSLYDKITMYAHALIILITLISVSIDASVQKECHLEDTTLVCIGGVSTRGNWAQDVTLIKLKFPTETFIDFTEFASLEEAYITNTELKCPQIHTNSKAQVFINTEKCMVRILYIEFFF